MTKCLHPQGDIVQPELNPVRQSLILDLANLGLFLYTSPTTYLHPPHTLTHRTQSLTHPHTHSRILTYHTPSPTIVPQPPHIHTHHSPSATTHLQPPHPSTTIVLPLHLHLCHPPWCAGYLERCRQPLTHSEGRILPWVLVATSKLSHPERLSRSTTACGMA